MNCKFAHTCIRVFNLEKSIKFYEKALGLEVSARKDFPEAKFTLVYMKEQETDFKLELTYNYDQDEPYDLGSGYSHIAFFVDNLEETRKRHQTMGLNMTEIKSLPNSSTSYYFLIDPDGYRIELISN